MPLTTRFDQALVYASDLHRNQLRNRTTIPYIAHLLSVSSRVLYAGGTEDQAIGGLLHDAAEDQGGEAVLAEIRARFGEDVARIVHDCTDSWTSPKPAWRPRKEAYLSLLSGKPATSLLVSLADKVDNAEAILRDYQQIGDAIWNRFAGGIDGTIWYYRELAAILGRTLPCPLARELSRIVALFPR
ncbi:MAG: HD domain-containing protein [Alphaproteobacteria bacterium]|nr:HD domain-containing protein [Alphaproteobacteria bacterium]